MRVLLLLVSLGVAAALVSSCGLSSYEIEKSPAFYESMAVPGAEVNVAAAASLLSDYRRANGLPSVASDSQLQQMARDQAQRMASANQLTHDPGGRGFTQRLKASGFQAGVAAENIGAGYHTLAEAFSGWRDSPSHNRNMLLPGATKFGLAAAYAPNSKYKVFWALVLAQPDTR